MALRDHWGGIIVLNVRAPNEDFNAKVGKEDVFRPTIRNDSLHEVSNHTCQEYNVPTLKHS
jgi:hypothetical protein